MSSSLSTKGLLNLFIVYLVWVSTYLFIRLTVQEGSGFPPFAMAASRTLCASAILFGLAGLDLPGHLRVPDQLYRLNHRRAPSIFPG